MTLDSVTIRKLETAVNYVMKKKYECINGSKKDVGSAVKVTAES